MTKGLDLSIKHKDFNLMAIVNNAVKEMSEGELLQIEKARRLDITEDIYFEVIRQKQLRLLHHAVQWEQPLPVQMKKL